MKQIGDEPWHQNHWRIGASMTLARIRALILQADLEMIEERKWRHVESDAGVPVWSHNGIVCTGETYKNAVTDDLRQGRRL